MSAEMSRFHAYCVQVTSRLKPPNAGEIKKIESFFSDFVIGSGSFNEVLVIMMTYSSSCDSGCSIEERDQHLSCCLFSAQLFHKICSKNIHIDPGSDELIGIAIEKILVITNTSVTTGTKQQLLLGLAALLTRKIVARPTNESLSLIIRGLTQFFPLQIIIEILGYIPEHTKMKFMYGKLPNELYLRAVEQISMLLIQEMTQIIPQLVQLYTCVDSALISLLLSWIHLLIELDVGNANVVAINYINGIISSPVVNLVTQYIEQHLDSNDELMSNSIDLLSSLCEATLLGPNISVVFSLHVVLPFINRIIESSKSHVSRLSMVYRILSVTVIHLTPSIVAGEVVPLWTQFMLLLADSITSYRQFVVNSDDPDRYGHLEATFPVLLSIAEHVHTMVNSSAYTNSILHGIQHAMAQVILSSTYKRVAIHSSTHNTCAIVIDEYLTDYRSELRDFLREFSNYCPEVTVTWLVTCATDSLREYTTNGQNGDVVEVLLHAITSVTKYIVAREYNQIINDFMLQLSHIQVVGSREICRLAVVIYGELIPLSVGIGRQQILLNMLFSVKHSEQLVYTVPFRVKQDHIGIVTATKAAQAGFYTATSAMDLNKIYSLYRDIMTPLTIESLYYAAVSTDGAVSLMDMLYASTIYSCCKTSQITWKSSRIMITGLITALGTNYLHEYSRLPEYYLCILPFFAASAYWYGVESSRINGYLSSRIAVQLTPAMITIMLELGEAIGRDGIDDVLTALAAYTESNGVLVATIVSDLLIPWLELAVNSAVMSDDRAAKLTELGKIISVSAMLTSCTNNSNMLDPSLVAVTPSIMNNLSEQTMKMLHRCVSAGLDPAVCNQLLASAANHVKCIYSWMSTTSPIRGELAHLLVAYMNSVSTLICGRTTNDETIGYLFLFWCNLLENTDLMGAKGLVAVSMFNEATVLAIVDFIYHFTHHNRSSSNKVWGRIIRLVSVLLGCNDDCVLAKEGPIHESKWLDFLHASGKGYIILHMILMMIAGVAPSFYREDLMRLIQKFYISFGASVTSAYFATCLNASICGDTLLKLTSIKQEKMMELGSKLQQFAQSDWKKFKANLKTLAKQ